ncbi:MULTISPECIES: hypothetical protein [Serratia]|uniref:hypothetical protein n=1 Tax=Serratia TaxID=613 RepID=UPI000A50A595|nr:hypothetical protein [Serratia marcescens]
MDIGVFVVLAEHEEPVWTLKNLFDSCFDPVCHDQLYPAKPYAERREEIEAMFKDIKLPIK